jgi:nitrite reductase (NADH) large subunit
MRNPASDPIVVIGNGMAGLRLLQDLRDAEGGNATKDSMAPVVAIGAEPMEAYNRVLLSSLLSGESEYKDIALVNRRWYDEQDIELQIGVRVLEIDRKRKRLRLSTGQKMPYRKLILATGSEPVRLKMPGSDLQGVKTFRDLADVRDLKALAKTGKRAVVIGGGLLGLEAAHGLALLGMDVTIVHLMDRLMERQLDPSASYFLLREFRRRNIDVLLNTQTERLLGKVRVEGVEFRDGSHVECDVVVMAVGIRPNVALAKSAGLSIERGIVVDDTLRSSDPDIYAIGECAEHRGQVYGLVAPLYEQAKVCARDVFGMDAEPYTGSVVSTSLKVGGMSVFSAGDYLGLPGTEEITLADPTYPFYKKLVLQKGSDGTTCLAGAVLFGETGDAPWYLDLITQKTPIEAIRRVMIFARELAVPSTGVQAA